MSSSGTKSMLASWYNKVVSFLDSEFFLCNIIHSALRYPYRPICITLVGNGAQETDINMHLYTPFAENNSFLSLTQEIHVSGTMHDTMAG